MGSRLLCRNFFFLGRWIPMCNCPALIASHNISLLCLPEMGPSESRSRVCYIQAYFLQSLLQIKSLSGLGAGFEGDRKTAPALGTDFLPCHGRGKIANNNLSGGLQRATWSTPYLGLNCHIQIYKQAEKKIKS